MFPNSNKQNYKPMQRINYYQKKGCPFSYIITNLTKGKRYYSFNIIGIRGRKKALISKSFIEEVPNPKAPTLDMEAVYMDEMPWNISPIK
jgi:hypothetical protein